MCSIFHRVSADRDCYINMITKQRVIIFFSGRLVLNAAGSEGTRRSSHSEPSLCVQTECSGVFLLASSHICTVGTLVVQHRLSKQSSGHSCANYTGVRIRFALCLRMLDEVLQVKGFAPLTSKQDNHAQQEEETPGSSSYLKAYSRCSTKTVHYTPALVGTVFTTPEFPVVLHSMAPP